eukprot:1161469-Pelagomonas_calceolata.AAC.23
MADAVHIEGRPMNTGMTSPFEFQPARPAVFPKKAASAPWSRVWKTPCTVSAHSYQIEDISNLLNTGEVPNLFDTGDVIAIGEAVRTKARAARMDGSRADLYEFFTQEVRLLRLPVRVFHPRGAALGCFFLAAFRDACLYM